MIKLNFLYALFFFSLVGNMFPMDISAERLPSPSAAPVTHESNMEGAFHKAVDLFVAFHFPNSMARPSEFDLAAHLQTIKTEYQQISKRFHSSAGLAFLGERLQTEMDEVAILTALDILSQWPYTGVSKVVVPFVNHKDERIREKALSILKEDHKKSLDSNGPLH